MICGNCNKEITAAFACDEQDDLNKVYCNQCFIEVSDCRFAHSEGCETAIFEAAPEPEGRKQP